LLALPSCSAFKLSENTAAPSRTFGRFSVSEGRGLNLSPEAVSKPAPTSAPKTVETAPTPVIPQPAPVTPQPAPVVATMQKIQTAPAPQPVKPAEKPAVQKRHSEQDADQLRLPGDLLNQLPGEKDYKPSNSGANDGAPVIAKPPGSR